MMSKQRELDLTDIGKKLANAQSKEDLMNLLPQAASMLEDVEQSPPPSTIFAMKGCSDALVDPTLLGHKDKDVGVLVALCISEIMRIVAPDAPYSDDCLKEIFQLIVGIFRGLDDVHSPSFSSRVNILETVAKVRSCVVMLDLDCDDLITEMFEIFFTTISDKHPEPVFLAMQNVLSLVINEGEEVSSQILEVILNNLLRQKEGVSQAGHMLAVAVVEKSAEILEPYVRQFFILAMSDGRGLPTALKKDYHELIYELYCCAPQMVQGVLPYLKEQLVSNQVPIRLKATILLGRMFSVPGRQVAPEYQQLFSEFLKRLNDEDVDVRVAAVNCAKVYLETTKSPTVETSEILVALGEQLCCFDDGVRITAMNAICNFARVNLNLSPPGILHKVADCLQDTKVSIRIETLHKLAGVYRSYCTKFFEGFEAGHDQFEWIPSKIFHSCCGKGSADFIAQDMEIVICEELFDAELLPVEEQAKHWVAFFSTFDEQDKIALRHILSQKQKQEIVQFHQEKKGEEERQGGLKRMFIWMQVWVGSRRLQLEMLAYLSVRQTTEEKEMLDFQRKIESSFTIISDQFVDPPKAKEDLWELHKMGNDTVFKELSILLDPSTSIAHARAASAELLKKIGENHPQHDFLKILTTKCAYSLFSREHAHAFIQQILVYRNSARKERMTSTIDLLLEVAAYCPLLIDDVKENLHLLSKDDEEFIRNSVLDVISKNPGSSSYAHAAGSEVSSKLMLMSEELCIKEDCKQTKSAVAEITMTADSGLSSAAIYEQSSPQSQRQEQAFSDAQVLSEEEDEEEAIDEEVNHNKGEHNNDVLAKGTVGMEEPRLAEKDIVETEEKEQEEQEETVLVKRKRGRPKGSFKKLPNSSRMKSVGQIGPKKIPIAVNDMHGEETEQHDEGLPLKRKRGRPKGSNKKDGQSKVAEEAEKDGVKGGEDPDHVKSPEADGMNKHKEDAVVQDEEVNDSSKMEEDVVQEDHEGGGIQDYEPDKSQVHHVKERVPEIADVEEVLEDVVAEPKNQENDELKIKEAAVVDVVKKPNEQNGMKEEEKDGIEPLAGDNIKDPEEEVRDFEKDELPEDEEMEVRDCDKDGLPEVEEMEVIGDRVKEKRELAAKDGLKDQDIDKVEENAEDNAIDDRNNNGVLAKNHEGDAVEKDLVVDDDTAKGDDFQDQEAGGLQIPEKGESEENQSHQQEEDLDLKEYGTTFDEDEKFNHTEDEKADKHQETVESGHKEVAAEVTKEGGGLEEQDADETNKVATEGTEGSGLEKQDADETNKVVTEGTEGSRLEKQDADETNKVVTEGTEGSRLEKQDADETNKLTTEGTEGSRLEKQDADETNKVLTEGTEGSRLEKQDADETNKLTTEGTEGSKLEKQDADETNKLTTEGTEGSRLEKQDADETNKVATEGTEGSGLEKQDADETNEVTTEGTEGSRLEKQDADETNKVTTEGSGLEKQDADETNEVATEGSGLEKQDAYETNEVTTEGTEGSRLEKRDAGETNKVVTEETEEGGGPEEQDADAANNDEDQVVGDEEKGLSEKEHDAGMSQEGRSEGREEDRVKDQVEDEIKDQEETQAKMDHEEDGKDEEEGDGGVVPQKPDTQEDEGGKDEEEGDRGVVPQKPDAQEDRETEQEEEKEITQKADTGDCKDEDGGMDEQQQGYLSAKRKRGRPKGLGRKPKHRHPKSLGKQDVKKVVTPEVEKDQTRDPGIDGDNIEKVGLETPQRLSTGEEGEKDQEKHHIPTKRKRGPSKGSRKTHDWGTPRNVMDGKTELEKEITEKDGEDQEENQPAKRKHLPEDSSRNDAEEAGSLEHSSKNHAVELSSKDKDEEEVAAGVDHQDVERMPTETDKEGEEKDVVENLSAKRKAGRPKGSAAKNKRKLSVGDEKASESHEEALGPKHKRGRGHIESSDKKEIITEVFEKDVKNEGTKWEMYVTPKSNYGQPMGAVDKVITTYVFRRKKKDEDKDGDKKDGDIEENLAPRSKPGHPKGSGKKQIMGESHGNGDEQEGSVSTTHKNQGHPKSSGKKAITRKAGGDGKGREKEEQMEEGQTAKSKPGRPKSTGKKEIRSTAGIDVKTGQKHEEKNINTPKTKTKPGRSKGSINKAVREVSSSDEKASSSVQKSPAKKIAANKGKEDLVGCGIKVWWPLDRRFYKGEVISYDAKKKRHKVLYDDGEQEILDLGVERWQLTTKKQRFVKNPQDTSSTPAWAPVPLQELNKAKALAPQEDVSRPSNQLKQRSSSKSGKKRVSQEGKSNNLEAKFLKAKETPVKNTISEFDFDEDNDDDGEAPKGEKMKGKQVQSSSTSKGRTGSSGKVFKHSVGNSSTERPTTSRDSEGDAAAALSPDMSPGDGEPLNTWVIRRQKAH